MALPGYLAGASSFADATEFDEFKDNTLKTTTSDLLVVHTTFNSEVKSSGLYYLGWSYEYGQTLKNKRVTVNVEEKVSYSGTWQTIQNIEHTLGYSNTANNNSSFKIITIPVDIDIDLRISWGETVDGGVGSLGAVNFILWKVGEL